MYFLQSLNIIVGILHFGCAMVKNAYFIVYPSNFLEETIFITLYALTPISWILCKDECLVSYIIKKLNNPQYSLGDEPNNYKDMLDVCFNEYIFNISFHMNTILQIISLFVIKHRYENINTRMFYTSLVTKLIYIYDIKYNTSIRKILYPWFQIIMLCSFSGLLIQWYFF